MNFDDIISVAPMLDCTDRHFRYLMRLITSKTLLYTEMYTVMEVLQNKRDILAIDLIEKPIAVQFGGNEPELLARCTRLAEAAGYDEVNLNVGCPSDRVQNGRFGACLMLEPERVAECIQAMTAATHLPVTVKCRLGVDHQDSYEQLAYFVEQIAAAGCQKVIVHARKAWLKGLSPKQNREIPPLDYERVYKLKAAFPNLTIILNGGIKTLSQASDLLTKVDGVMIGRAAYDNPLLFASIDRDFYGQNQLNISDQEVVERYMDYVERELSGGARLTVLTRHLLGIFQGKTGARNWRKHLSTNCIQKNAGVEVIQTALAEIRQALNFVS